MLGPTGVLRKVLKNTVVNSLARNGNDRRGRQGWHEGSIAVSSFRGHGWFKLRGMERPVELHEAWEMQLKTYTMKVTKDLIRSDVLSREGTIRARRVLAELQIFGRQ